ncbi:PepSY domain-containing protein [Sphingomonas donggukensis]|uniref:PepSY domain-containing protein n=1 Tax=Sphingomonas donggukensis TaxID=2949093 RepID=A0ABY4TTN0_9SPHN|nr:PepSY domain-containing protein [Sphingomonas donggukensis]URW74772.1 PepSY domain-containing protein [Sphingomonas donggukensis]
MASSTPARQWPAYAAIWRWHFYAGLFCIPFVLWLATTGSTYLFKPQVEALIDRPYANVATAGPRATAAEQVTAAVRAVPGSVLHRYQLPDTPTEAVQIIVGQGGVETRVYIHPQTLAVLKQVREDDRLMRVVFRLHGELLAGDVGSYVVELAASWAIVMILSGLFLWWPRGRGIAGVLYPRLSRGKRGFWRDIHAVTGFWVSFMALFLLLSGLPWAKSWGGYLKVVRSVVEDRPARQDWTTSRADETLARAAADAGTRAMLGAHAEHGGMTMAHAPMSYAPLDRLVATVRPLELAAPVLIAPPTAMGAPWTAKSDAADRPRRTDLTLDGATGGILTRRDFNQRRLIDRLVGYGIAAHEGALFGWLNQLLNLLTALGLVLLSVSGVAMWWRRRPEGRLGAPPDPLPRPAAYSFAALVTALGLLLPLFGASLLAVLAIDRYALRRASGMRRWLGLRAANSGPLRRTGV